MNEYYEAYRELQEKSSFKDQQWFGKRQELVEDYAWAVPNEDALSYIENHFDHVTEIGAGSGYWAHCLYERGVTVTAFDIETDQAWYNVAEEPWYEVRRFIEDETVLMVWPPVDDPMASGVLKTNPSHVLYVGEQRGGCTASDEFFDRLDKLYGHVETVEIPSYEGVSDNLYHYVRNI